MTNPNDGVNKGFAFAIFCSPDDAKTAVRKVIVMSHPSHSVLKNILCQYPGGGSFPRSLISHAESVLIWKCVKIESLSNKLILATVNFLRCEKA